MLHKIEQKWSQYFEILLEMTTLIYDYEEISHKMLTPAWITTDIENEISIGDLKLKSGFISSEYNGLQLFDDR